VNSNLIFLQPEECENAYFKMDNVLIDDRRIHVDFSQSVSKIQGKPKGTISCNITQFLKMDDTIQMYRSQH